MLGAIVGDIVGSRYEWNNIKTKDFELFHEECRPTDDSIMTLAIAGAILSADPMQEARLAEHAVTSMQLLGNRYPRAGYGLRFFTWLRSQPAEPYGSYGNGAAMRVGPCAYAAGTLDEALAMAKAVTEVTHDHPEGIKGAQATTAAIFMALHGSSIDEIRAHIDQNYYPMDFTLDAIRPAYRYDITCQGTVPQAIAAFLESTGFEDAIRNAVSLGGDSDTLAAITGSIAGAYYGIPADIRNRAVSYLDAFLLDVLNRFEEKYMRRG